MIVTEVHQDMVEAETTATGVQAAALDAQMSHTPEARPMGQALRLDLGTNWSIS